MIQKAPPGVWEISSSRDNLALRDRRSRLVSTGGTDGKT